MIVAYIEDGSVEIYASLEEAMLVWGKYLEDIISDVVIFYDNDGAWLKPQEQYEIPKWYRLRKKIIGVSFGGVEIPNNEFGYGQDPIGYLVAHEAKSLKPNTFVHSLEELKLLYPY